MTAADLQPIIDHMIELRAIGYWLATLLAINAGLLAANIVSTTIQFRLGR